MREVFASVKRSSRALLRNSAAERTAFLNRFSALINEQRHFLLEANEKDLALAETLSLNMRQRLTLDSTKIDSLISGINTLASMSDPVGATIASTILDEDLVLHKVSVPIGVLGIIFESRPDVIPQILSLALRSGNAVILKGGSEARHSNAAFMELIKKLNTECASLPESWALLIEGREAAMTMLECPESIDLIIPRGSNALVAEIMSKSKVPVLGHADGVCHIYVDKECDTTQALTIILDAKTQYPAACNAVETILIHQDIPKYFLETLNATLTNAGVSIKYPTDPIDWHTEYGDLTVAIRTVSSVDQAIDHINTHGSHHTDVILSTDPQVQETFLQGVDSACVFINCSSRFADGQRFGLGAEVGIATGKLHARGPVGIEGLLTTQYRLFGNGQIVATYSGDLPKKFIHKKIL